jgi:hypothetical protein
MPRLGFETTIQVFELTRTHSALERAATVIGFMQHYKEILLKESDVCYIFNHPVANHLAVSYVRNILLFRRC